MIDRRAAIGIGILCALAISGFAVQGAMAVPTGTTAFTCKIVVTEAQFTDEHCKTGGAGGAGFKHEKIAENTTTEILGDNSTTAGEENVVMKLKSTIEGIPFEIQALGVGLAGQLTNMVDSETGEHTANGIVSIGLGNATVTKPAASECVIRTDKLPLKEKGPEKEIGSRVLRITTSKQGDALKFEPNEGTILASFWVEGCEKPALNKTYDLTGSFKSTTIAGSTINFNHEDTTTQNTLKLAGQKAGLEGGITLVGRDPEKAGDVPRPLSFTTVTTP